MFSFWGSIRQRINEMPCTAAWATPNLIQDQFRNKSHPSSSLVLEPCSLGLHTFFKKKATIKMTNTNTDNTSDLYVCLPLPRESKFIRVLDIYGRARPDDSHSSIQCDLRVVNLDSENHPSFAALSYVWEIEAAEGHFITCGDCTLRVTPNCHSAL
jgi:hypothetical protein